MAIQNAGRLQFQDLFEVVGVGAFTVDFPNSATGSGTNATALVTVPGAALGDIVMVGLGVDPVDAAVVGHVNAANSVELILLNNTAGAVNLASHKLRLVVLRVAAQYDIV